MLGLLRCQLRFRAYLLLGQLTGGYKNSTCSGDSGGPVYVDNGSGYVQIGITSFGPSVCGDGTQPVTSVFTEISDYYSWILRVMNGLETPKYYVTESNGVRQLVDGESDVSDADSSSNNSSGGSVGLSLLALGIVLIRRNKVKYW